MSGGGDSSGFLAGVLLLVIVSVFGTGWFFDLYEFAKAEVEEVRSGEVTVPQVTVPDVPDLSTTVPDVSVPGVPDLSTTVPDVDAAEFAAAPTWDTPFPTPTAGDYTEAWSRLETLTVAPATAATVYARSQWMVGWAPIAGDPVGAPALPSGCDVREFEFNQWAQPGSHKADYTCRASVGVYFDGYLGVSYTIPADRAVSAVDVEHMVALAEAHRSGGDRWDPIARNQFATDYTIRSYHHGGTQLFLTDGSENQHVKSDNDPAAYLPAHPGSRCGFVVNHIAVKHRYQLAADAEEVSALIDYLTVCEAGGIPDRP